MTAPVVSSAGCLLLSQPGFKGFFVERNYNFLVDDLLFQRINFFQNFGRYVLIRCFGNINRAAVLQTIGENLAAREAVFYGFFDDIVDTNVYALNG